MISLQDAVAETLQAVRDTVSRKAQTGATTGFPQVDFLTRGMRSGSLTVLASHPSMGKTTFALNVVHNLLEQKPETPILYCSQRCPMELTFRWLSIFSGVSLSVYYDGNRRVNEIEKVLDSEAENRKYPLFFADCRVAEDAFFMEIAAWCTKNRPQLLIFDTVRRRELARVKRFALELDLPVLALVHCAGIMAGEMEAADTVLRLANDRSDDDFDTAYDPDGKKPIVLVVEKNRFGLCGVCKLDYFPKTLRFEDASFVVDPAYAPRTTKTPGR